MHIDLKSGNSIEITPIQGLKAKHRDAYEGAPKLYITFDEAGKPDLSSLPVSMSISKIQRNALLATLITGWSFTMDDGTTPLPVPRWADNEILNDESFGEIPIDDFTEIEEILVPYLAKVQRKPDPTRTTTASSTAS